MKKIRWVLAQMMIVSGTAVLITGLLLWPSTPAGRKQALGLIYAIRDAIRKQKKQMENDWYRNWLNRYWDPDRSEGPVQ